MEVKEFIKTIKEELPTFLPDEVCRNIDIDDVEVAKMNDQKLHGLTFRPKGSDAAPTIYVDDLYERHENGEDMGFLLVDLANRYRDARHAPTPPAIDLSWETVRDNLTVRLLEKSRNRDFLANMPYADVGGMYVLTTESSTLGACAMYYPDVKEKAGELIGSDYYILPSSVHEVILIPDTAGIDAKELCDMVRQANRTVVEEKDILSDNVYHYSRDERRLDKVNAEPNRADRVAEAVLFFCPGMRCSSWYLSRSQSRTRD